MRFIVLLDVIAPFHSAIQCNYVPQIQLYSVGVCAIGDALHFFPVFRFDVRPHHVLGCVTEELPILPILVRLFEGGDFQRIFDLWREQVAVLEADFGRGTFEVHKYPTVVVGPAKGML